jgi:hypothetical protein
VEHLPDPEKRDDLPLRKPSFLSQAVPYLFTAAILIWVFTGLSSNVLDERHTLSGTAWVELTGSGIRIDSIEIQSHDGAETYCGFPEGGSASAGRCPNGPDFAFRKHPDRDKAMIRRLETTRIPDGAWVSVNYVKKVKLSEIWAMVKGANLSLFLPVMFLHTIVFFFADVFSFGSAYRWFNAPDLKTREMMEVRGAPYVIQVGLAPLAEALFPLYMWRVKKVPITETVSSNIWAMIMDFSAIFSVITPAVIYNLYVENLVPAIGPAWLAGCLAFWAFFVGNLLFWKTPPGRRMTARFHATRAGSRDPAGIKGSIGGAGRLLHTFGLARWHHIVRCYLARAVLLASTLVSNYVAIRALGMDPALPMALIGIPIIVLSIFMPVGVGGYGGPQLIAWFLFVSVGHVGSPDQVIAYSMLWSTAFLAGRAAIGLLFIRGFWRRCFPGGGVPAGDGRAPW